jgi:hypothetical protein
MKTVFFLLIFFVNKVSFSSTEFPEPHLFKIGFEFQESHHMCPWAVEEPEIQSTPIFSICLGDRTLWDLTIDWQDLEFVTSPITNNEITILRMTMRSMQIACDALVTLNEEAKYTTAITFSKWIKRFQEDLKNHEDPDISSLSIEIHPVNSLSLGSFAFPVSYGSRFDFVFQPQVTIQHHLQDSITLCLGLFVEGVQYDEDKGRFDINKSNAKYLNDFITRTTLFNKETPSNEGEAPYSFSKRSSRVDGFLFLHMFTCIDLSQVKPPKEVACGDLDISKSTSQTKTMCILHFDTGQVNPKSSVNFMSRRPFSLMWQDIAHPQSYEEVLREKVDSEFLDDMKRKFEDINYGEIFFTEDGKRMDLTECLFSTTFTDPNIHFLLRNGIISLEFIRLLRVSFLQNYFDEAVKSVSHPKLTQRCAFDKEARTLKTVSTGYDLLSPPHLVSEKDSMGAYKDNSKIDRMYGEAIVEVRMIASIPESVLCQINEQVDRQDEETMKGKFLSRDFSRGSSGIKIKFINPNYDLQTQAEGLFLYIEKLINGGIQ